MTLLCLRMRRNHAAFELDQDWAQRGQYVPLFFPCRARQDLSAEHRILSPVRLPYSWYWKHVAVILKGFDCKAVTILP